MIAKNALRLLAVVSIFVLGILVGIFGGVYIAREGGSELVARKVYMRLAPSEIKELELIAALANAVDKLPPEKIKSALCSVLDVNAASVRKFIQEYPMTADEKLGALKGLEVPTIAQLQGTSGCSRDAFKRLAEVEGSE